MTQETLKEKIMAGTFNPFVPGTQYECDIRGRAYGGQGLLYTAGNAIHLTEWISNRAGHSDSLDEVIAKQPKVDAVLGTMQYRTYLNPPSPTAIISVASYSVVYTLDDDLLKIPHIDTIIKKCIRNTGKSAISAEEYHQRYPSNAYV